MPRTMPAAAPKSRQIASRKNLEGYTGGDPDSGGGVSPAGAPRSRGRHRLPRRLARGLLRRRGDHRAELAGGAAPRPRPLPRLHAGDQRSLWTSRLSRAFLDALRNEIDQKGQRRFSDRTIARIAAHLKTFAKWIHALRPFRLGNPTAQLKTVLAGPGLEIERALTESQRRKLLDAADHLPILGGRSRDRRRAKDVEFADERPRRKGYRPWR